jgi:hypothetical protein
MSDQLGKKHCSLSQHLSGEPKKTINTSVRITSLHVDIRTPDRSITNHYTAVQFTGVCSSQEYKTQVQNSLYKTNDLLYTLFDVF